MKVIQEGNIKVKWDKYIDDMGIWREILQFQKINENGTYINYPALPKIKVENYSPDSYLYLEPKEPTEDEMKEYLQEAIKLINQ